MTESFWFRTRSGREILLVPAHAVRPLEGDANASRDRALREDPRGASALMRARDDAWSTSRDLVVVDLGVPGAPGRPLFGSDAAVVNWDDIPRLGDRRPIGGITVEPPKPSSNDPRAIDPAAIDPAPADTWTSFVAFTVVDQHGKPVTGRARCSVDGTVCAGTLDGTVIEQRPIPTLARIELELSELHSLAPKAGRSSEPS